MRIKINFTKNTEPISVNNQKLINSYIHTKCLGNKNDKHDSRSDYSISSLMGGKLNKDDNTIDFSDGGYIVISSQDINFINSILIGVLNNIEFIGGMKFSNIDHVNEKFFNGWNHFATLSPFIMKNYESITREDRFLKIGDTNFVKRVEDRIKSKLLKINEGLNINNKLDLADFKIEIKDHSQHKVKKIMVKHVVNDANQCQISILTNKRVAELLYNIGIGQSTGSGFGTIYKTENHKLYKLGLKKCNHSNNIINENAIF